MKVKALVAHSNGWGEDFAKKKGAEYELPDIDAEALIGSGIVESAEALAKPAKAGDTSPA